MKSFQRKLPKLLGVKLIDLKTRASTVNRKTGKPNRKSQKPNRTETDILPGFKNRTEPKPKLQTAVNRKGIFFEIFWDNMGKNIENLAI